MSNDRALRCMHFILCLVVLVPAVTWAGRPLVIDDAEPVAPGLFELELGAAYVDSSDVDHFDFPMALSFGVVPSLEMGVGFGGQMEEREETHGSTAHASGIGDLVLGMKWKWLNERKWLPAQSIVPAIKFPTADRSDQLGTGELDYDVTWIASKQIIPKINVHLNAGYSWVGDPDDEELGDLFHYGLALDYQLVDPVQLVGELYAFKECIDGQGTVLHYNGGLRWMPLDALVLDVAAGSAFRGDGPDFFTTIGLTWTIGRKRGQD